MGWYCVYTTEKWATGKRHSAIIQLKKTNVKLAGMCVNSTRFALQIFDEFVKESCRLLTLIFARILMDKTLHFLLYSMSKLKIKTLWLATTKFWACLTFDILQKIPSKAQNQLLVKYFTTKFYIHLWTV